MLAWGNYYLVVRGNSKFDSKAEPIQYHPVFASIEIFQVQFSCSKAARAFSPLLYNAAVRGRCLNG